jgi:tetratricopeptide (TPR) repeat protein
MRLISQGVVVLGCLASASAGFADNSAKAPFKFAQPKNNDAREHLKRGARLYNNQDFKAAIEEFKAGALAEPCSTFDYDLGQSYRQLGLYKEALWHYQRFLDNGHPTGDALQGVQDLIAEMQAHLANAARTMPPTEPAPGPDATQPEPPTRAAVKPEQPTMQRSAMQHDADTRHAPPDDERRGSVNWIGWTVTVGGVATLGTTGYLILRASNLDNQANMSIDNRMRSDLHDQASTRRLAGAIVGVGGIALTATGIYLLSTSRHQDHPTTASLDVGLTGRGVVVFGRF